MTPISSINHSPVSAFQFQSRQTQRARALASVFSPVAANSQQVVDSQPELDLINQVYPEQTRQVTDIFRSINIHANQALEPGQNFENRENLQTEVDADISRLRSVLDEITQDDLTLFITIFQNQLPAGIIGSGITNNTSVSGLFSNDASNASLESLLRFDVTSETSALASLDFSSSIIETLTGNTRGSGFLESLLNDLTNSLISAAVQERSSDVQEQDVTTDSSDNDASVDVEPAAFTSQLPPLTPPGSNPPTIIEFTG